MEDEKPFVPRFVEEKAPRKPRKNPFPQNEVEFCICAANGFARDGHTVLVYSPLRSQVEPLAREFRHMRDQGYLDNVKTPRPEVLAVAQAIGREWLGTDHAAVRALEAGVGTHHGALPRPFLSAVEELLDARKLSVVVASPTLAQGIDLACSVLIFRSLRRYEDGNWVSISPAEFANVVGRAGRAYVDLDGISVLPTFDPQSRQQLHTLFNSLVKASRGQTLVSGLAQLIGQIAGKLAQKLGVPSGGLLEYVLNQRDLWEDARLLADKEAGEEDQIEDTLLDNVSDLDVALFSLIEPLDIDADQLATALDEALKGSLWQRTLKHLSAKVGSIEQEIFHSRAEWIWNRTTAKQRAACFYSGLGYKAGLFLHDQLDILVDTLCDLQAAVAAEDGDSAATAAVEFADLVMREPFFAVRRLPEKWEDVLKAWVNGTAFSEILDGRNARDAQRTQAFVQEGTVFRLVWAAEAVRVQAIATEHSRVDELGDGPAFALTYGVPSIPAALLCQMGFSSRVGSIWVTKELSANFTDTVGLHNWLREHDASLSEPEFWISEDHFLLWSQASRSTTTEHPRPWRHETHTISANWNVAPPSHGNGLVRVIPGNNRTVTICRPDLRPIGTAGVPFDPRGAALEGKIMPKGKVQVMYFGQS